MQNIDIAIIGAGLTGLTTAFYLTRTGKQTLIFEKKSTVGGVISTVSENGFVYECGPNTGVIAQPEVVELFDDLGIADMLEVAGKNVNKRFVLKNCKWHQIPTGLIGAIATPLFSLKDKLGILGEPFTRPGKKPNETLAEMVKRRMGVSFLNYAIDPFILGVYAGDPNMLVTKYALPKLYNLEQKYGSFIGGSIKKKREPKTERDKKANRKVFSARNGMSTLIRALEQQIGVDRFVLDANNIKVSPANGHYIITGIQNGKCFEYEANTIITTTGAYTLGDILPFINEDAKKIFAALVYAPVVEVVLGFENWNGIPLNGFGGLIPHLENRKILGVLYMSTLFENRAPKDGALLSVFVGGVRNQQITTFTDKQIKEIVASEIKSLMKIKDFDPDIFKINRHPHAIPQYYADSGIRFEIIEQIQKKYHGLILGGNMLGGIGMADRIKQGKYLADSLL